MNGYVSKQHIAVAITGGSTSGVVPVCTAETATPPPATSNSKPAETDLHVQPCFKQQGITERAEISLYICGKPGKEGICAHISGAAGGEEGRKASRISRLYMVSVNSTWSEPGKSLSLISRELPPDCEHDFTFTYVEGGTLNFYLISHHFSICVCVCVYLIELSVPAVNVKYFRDNNLRSSASLLIQPYQLFKLRRFLGDLLWVTQIETSNIKGKHHYLLSQVHKHSLWNTTFMDSILF